MDRATTGGRLARRAFAAVLAAAISLVGASVRAQEAAGPTSDAAIGQWEYRLTPYVWFTGVQGTMAAGGNAGRIDVSFSDVLRDLDVAAMMTLEARRDKLLLLMDAFYVRTTSDFAAPSPMFSGGSFTAESLVLSVDVGRRVVDAPRGAVDLMAGLRYWRLRNTLDLRAGASPGVRSLQRKNWADPVVGGVLYADLPRNWQATLKADIGGFDVGSDFTWQLAGVLRRALGRSSALVIGYRYLDVDYDRGGFVYDVVLQGPVLGYQFRF